MAGLPQSFPTSSLSFLSLFSLTTMVASTWAVAGSAWPVAGFAWVARCAWRVDKSPSSRARFGGEEVSLVATRLSPQKAPHQTCSLGERDGWRCAKSVSSEGRSGAFHPRSDVLLPGGSHRGPVISVDCSLLSGYAGGRGSTTRPKRASLVCILSGSRLAATAARGQGRPPSSSWVLTHLCHV